MQEVSNTGDCFRCLRFLAHKSVVILMDLLLSFETALDARVIVLLLSRLDMMVIGWRNMRRLVVLGG